ncbi:MAG TPA: hypothetical protein VEA81_14260 [Burkholderiaceae bacterium]|nr:hypothetical protein [Burkholderiaceae bacterium]
MAAPHLVACVSAHGWGHLSQTVPMVAALAARLPGLRTTVRTGLPAALVQARFVEAGLPRPDVSFEDADFGLAMHDALRIDDAASIERHLAVWAGRDARLEREREALRATGADLVLANASWIPLAAAASLGLPAFGASSLNWAELLEQRAATRDALAGPIAWMRECYGRADALFALEPGLPFDGFERRVRIAPIARRGRSRPRALREALGVPEGTRVMVAAFGGMPLALRTERWRLPAGWVAVSMAEAAAAGGAVRDGRALGWSYLDLLASCDLLLGKPGYGTFAEAGFAGRDTLAVPRPDWPEAPWLERWLARHARFATLPAARLADGDFDAAIAAIAAQPARTPADGDGAAEIAGAIARRMGVG